MLSSAAMAQDSDKILWSITPYIWASTTKIDAKVREADGSGEIPFNDLLDALDAAFMIQVEGGKGNWSVFGDLTYLDASKTTVRDLVTAKVDSKMVFLDTAVAFWPGGFGSPLSLFGGLRYTGFDSRFRLTGNLGELINIDQPSDNDYYDALLGIRYRFDFSQRWQLLTHGDVSFGDSEGTFLLRADLAYVVGKRQRNRIMLGYQYKQADFKDGDIETDYTYYGPMAGFDFRF